MNVLASWLREWVNPNVSDTELAEQLTMAGLEVDGIHPIAPDFDHVLVGEVISCEKHPDADKLNLCQVNIGENKNLQIICGASNVRQGLKVVVATVGANLPGGLKIKKAKLRGVESFGMICSESELGLADSSEGIMELDSVAPIGENIRDYLNLDDNLIELDITPNRGDCFSILGVSREVSSNYNIPHRMPEHQVSSTIDAHINSKVTDFNACPKYLTRVIKGVDNTVQTPEWMAQRLTRSGQQLHSPVVDITNYVLLELGQPMHAFDTKKISGGINVRMAKQGESIELLNEQTIELNNDTLVIADDEKALAVAGIMGGMHTSTQANSDEILLESAFFEPTHIAGKARNYGLHTESSLRFERGVDFGITELAMERASELVLQICGGEAGSVNVCIDKESLPKLEAITITQQRIQQILGFELDSDWILEKFKNLDFEIIDKSADSWTILPPSFRFDIRIQADLIEELARLYGYDKLPVKSLSLDADIKLNPEAELDKYDIAQTLVGRGYQEVITYSFISKEYQDLISPNAKHIALANPISNDMSIMRSSLWAGLLQSVSSNQRRGYTDVKFFEIGLCFDGIKAQDQSQKIAGVITGNRFSEQWSTQSKATDFFDLKADVESLLGLTGKSYEFKEVEDPALQKGQSAQILLDDEIIGLIGTLSPLVQKKLSLAKCYLFELDLSKLQQGKVPKYHKFSAYQNSRRDIALVIDEDIPSAELIKVIKQMNQNYLKTVELFDVYKGESIGLGKKSLAIALNYQSDKATLTDDEVNQQVKQVLDLMQEKFKAEQR